MTQSDSISSADTTSRKGPPPLPLPLPLAAISYRRVQIGVAEWAVVESFTNVGQWHAAKAMLDRNNVLSRMGSNPFDEDATDLLVPATEVLWAADLIRRMNDPQIEQSLGFPMVSPPPLPKAADLTVMDHQPEPAGAMRVLELSQPSDVQEVLPNYGCAIAVLWILLGVTVLLVLLFFATYQA